MTQVDAIDQNPTRLRRVQADQQIGDRAFAGTAGPHQGRGAAPRQLQVDLVKSQGLARAVAQTHLLQNNALAQADKGATVEAAVLLVGAVEQVLQAGQLTGVAAKAVGVDRHAAEALVEPLQRQQKRGQAGQHAPLLALQHQHAQAGQHTETEHRQKVADRSGELSQTDLPAQGLLHLRGELLQRAFSPLELTQAVQ